MPDKFENATLLLWICLPSTPIRLYPHKKFHENGTFCKHFPEWNNLKMIYFCISVDGELFVYADVILSCNLSSQVLQHGKEYDIFCVLDNIYLL